MSGLARVAATCALLAVPATALASAVPPAQGCAPREWPQPRQSPCGTAANDDPRAPSVASAGETVLRWTAALPTPIGDPVVSGGRVYVTVGKQRPRLDARSVVTGKYVWSAITGSGRGAAALDGNALLRESDEGALRRYDPSTGRILWRRNRLGGERLTVAAGGVWYSSTGSELVAVDDRRGSPVWSTPLTCFRCAPAVSGDRIYAAGSPSNDTSGSDARLFAYDAQTHAVLWSAHGQGNFAFLVAPIVAGGRIIVVTDSVHQRRSLDVHVFYASAFSAKDGHTLWITQLGSTRGFLPYVTPAAGDGIVAVALTNQLLYGIDQRTGKVLWSTVVGAVPTALSAPSSPAIANGVVWMVGSPGVLKAIASDSGRTLWTGRELHVCGSPAVADGLVLVPTDDGLLLAYGRPS